MRVEDDIVECGGGVFSDITFVGCEFVGSRAAFVSCEFEQCKFQVRKGKWSFDGCRIDMDTWNGLSPVRICPVE